MRTLLLADDNVSIRRVMNLAFAGEDVRIVVVGDGEEAIARIPGERPDVVLAEIEMARGSGYDVAVFVKGQPDLAHIPVLLMAGAFDPVDTERAEQAGCAGILIKPFDPVHVVRRVRELIDGAPRLPADGVSAVPPSGERLAPSRRDPIPFRSPERARVAGGEAMPPDSGNPGPRPAPDGSLDEYFDRLDVAFASLGSVARGTPAEPLSASSAIDPDADLPTLDDLLSGSEPYEHRRDAVDPFDLFLSEQTPTPRITTPQSSSSGASASGRVARPALSDVAAARAADDARLDRPDTASLAMTEALLEDVTRRVLERLTRSRFDAAVRDIVSEVAERLVRDEIRRIRNGK